jgi:hypothetical protein
MYTLFCCLIIKHIILCGLKYYDSVGANMKLCFNPCVHMNMATSFNSMERGNLLRQMTEANSLSVK